MTTPPVVGIDHIVSPVASFVPGDDPEWRSEVVILKDAYIVMAGCHIIFHVDKVGWVDAWMLKIVHRCGNQAAQLLKIVHLKQVFDAAFDWKVVEGLADVRCMRLVVIWDPLIAHCQGSCEIDQFNEVNFVRSNKIVPYEDEGH